MIRPAVAARAARGKTATPGGMRVFGTLMTCPLAWERRGAGVTAELLGVLKDWPWPRADLRAWRPAGAKLIPRSRPKVFIR